MREFAHEFVDEFFANFAHEFKYEIRTNSRESYEFARIVRIRMNFLHENLVMLQMACTVVNCYQQLFTAVNFLFIKKYSFLQELQ